MNPVTRRTLTSALFFLAIAPLGIAAAPTSAHADGARNAAKADKSRVASDDIVATPAPYRAHFGWSDIYVPGYFQPVNGTYDLIVHFHGVPKLQEDNLDEAKINAIVVSMNLGIGSGYYSDYFQGPKAFENLLASIQSQVEKSGRAPGAHVGRIALQAWSAGFGAVGKILNQPTNASRIDAVLLADGFHANYIHRPQINDAALAQYVAFANLAMTGDRLFVMTHSSIMTEGYPSTTDTTAYFLKLTSLEKTATPGHLGPRGMREIYETHRGNLHVSGWEGMGVNDHVDHVKAMHATMYPYLKARWTSR